jgi:hypothetical protein
MHLSTHAITKPMFTLVKFSVIIPAISQCDITLLTCLGHHGRRDINKNDPICVELPKVAKASTAVTVM